MSTPSMKSCSHPSVPASDLSIKSRVKVGLNHPFLQQSTGLLAMKLNFLKNQAKPKIDKRWYKKSNMSGNLIWSIYKLITMFEIQIIIWSKKLKLSYNVILRKKVTTENCKMLEKKH